MQRLALAVTLILLGVLIGVRLLIDFQHIRESEEEKLLTQTTLIASNLQLHIRSANDVLEEILALQDFAAPEEQLDRMHSLVNAVAFIRGIGMADSRGKRIRGTRRSLEGADLSNRPYFKGVLARPERTRLYVSTPFQGVMGGLSFALSKAIIDERGQFQGVVYAVLEPDYLIMLMQSTLYAPDMWAALRHVDTGDIVRVGASWRGQGGIATQTDAPGPRGAMHAGAVFVAEAGGGEPQLMAASNVMGYASNADRPLMVVTGRDYDEAMAPWRRLAYLQGGLYLLFVLAAVPGLLLYQHWRRQYDARGAADQRRLHAREQNYLAIVERTADCVAKLDCAGRITHVNPSFRSAFGLTAAQAQRGVVFDHFVHDDRELAGRHLDMALRDGSEQRFDACCDTPQGQRHMQWTFCSVLDDDGVGRGVLAVGHDVSEHIAVREQLRDRAHHDSLTGLVNRGHFLEVGAAEISRAQRYGEALTLLMADLDHFKGINDTRGHHAGDVALQTCARVLRQQCRDFDIAARIGGEEFVVMLPNTDVEEAIRVAERLRQAIADAPVILEDGSEFQMTTSIGVAGIRPGESLHAAMQRADAALYAAKAGGRNRVEAATDQQRLERAH